MTEFQRKSVVREFENIQGAGVLDYVTAWYVKAARYIQNTNIKVAFVSTNSIVQGEQVSILWKFLLERYGINIHFAHRTFKWGNEAKGNAAVYCVIIGFGTQESSNKLIFDYEDIKGEPTEIIAKNINPYLVDAKSVFIEKRRTPICKVPEISFGSMPNDGGNFLFTEEEKNIFLQKEPNAEKFFRPLISAHEFLNGQNRWCLWLKDANPTEIKSSKLIIERIENVKKLRSQSSRESTQRLANFPTLFGEDRQPTNNYLLIPRVSSENRLYIPMDFVDKNSIVGDTCLFISNCTLVQFGVLMSKMHIAWVKTVCGRLKSDFRYSNEIVYNNFPWCPNPSEKHIKNIEIAAQKVLDVRKEFPNSSLADLYDPLSMPPALVKAHTELDKAVDLAYRPQPFTSDANRMEYLFDLYEQYTANLFTKEKVKKGKKK
jgi:hypothetical protein